MKHIFQEENIVQWNYLDAHQTQIGGLYCSRSGHLLLSNTVGSDNSSIYTVSKQTISDKFGL